MASFTLFVTSAPYTSQNAYSAYRFAQAAINNGHKILSVFFYLDGTLNGSDLTVFPSTEFDLADAWQSLAKQNDVPLQVCVTAASKRGILSPQDAQDADRPYASLSSAFESVGLGDLAVSIKQADRLVQF